MRLIICAAFLIIVQGRIIDQGCQDGVIVNDHLFEKEVLKTDLALPYQFAIDYDTNLLFFSHGFQDNHETEEFTSAVIDLKTNEYKRIQGIPDGFAHAIDRQNHIIYMGSDSGIYTYNFGTKKAEFFGDSNANIWQMFFKDRLYYTVLDEHAYFFDKGMSHEVPELKSTRAKLLGVDTKDNVIFANATGMFWYHREHDNIEKLGELHANGITSDLNGNIVFSTLDGIYTIDTKGEIRLVAKVGEEIYAVAIDDDGSIVYATEDTVIRLKRTNKTCTAQNTNKTANNLLS